MKGELELAEIIVRSDEENKDVWVVQERFRYSNGIYRSMYVSTQKREHALNKYRSKWYPHGFRYGNWPKITAIRWLCLSKKDRSKLKERIIHASN